MVDIQTTDTSRPAVSNATAALGERAVLAFDASSYVEWGAVLAGAVASLAVTFVLLTFGAAVGLSAVSPWTSGRGTVTALSYGAAFWVVLVNVWAFALAGYLAGRMRHRRSGATQSESEFRDGAHGVTAWALAVSVGAIVAALAASSLARGALDAGTAAARSVSFDPVSVATDSMLRTNRPADARPEDVRAEIAGILARSGAQAEVTSADRTYLAQLIAARTGIGQQDAERRVDGTIATMKQAADKARKTAVVMGFLTAASLLLGAAAAWWGATTGGRHRDEGSVWGGLGSRRYAALPSRTQYAR